MRPTLAAVVVLASLAACGDDDTATAPTTTLDGAVSTSTSTTTSSTTTSTSTTSTSTTTSSTTTSTTVPDPTGHGYDGGTFVAQSDRTLGEYRIADGSLIRLIDELEATWAGRIEVTNDGAVFASVGFEDAWFSCDTDSGRLWHYPAGAEAPVEPVDLGPGSQAALAPSEDRIAFLTASDCRPDPAQADFVVAPPDTVVVRDLTTGDEQRWTFPGATYDTEALDVVDSLIWTSPTSLTVAVDDQLVILDVDDPAVPDPAAGVPIEVAVGDLDDGPYLHGHLGDLLVASHYTGAAGAELRVVTIDPATGGEVEELANAFGSTADVDVGGEHLALVVDGDLFLDGTEVRVEGANVDGYVFAVGW